jgi:phosphoserine phosphatase
LSGQLVFKHHKELFEIFNSIDQINNIEELHLDFPLGIDLSFLQMLASFQKKRDGRSVVISASLQEADEKLIARTGFSVLLNNQVLYTENHFDN